MTWLERLKKAVERCWKHHGAALSIGWFQTKDLFGTDIHFAYPVYQEIVGGKDDGLKVWTGFRFILGELLKNESLTVKNIEVASHCNHCNPHPMVELVGTFEGNEFDLIVMLEPKLYTEAVEILDIASQSVRLIDKENES